MSGIEAAVARLREAHLALQSASEAVIVAERRLELAQYASMRAAADVQDAKKALLAFGAVESSGESFGDIYRRHGLADPA